MKTIYLSEDHERFRETVRQFLKAEVAPHAEEWEAAGRIPRAIWTRMGSLGLLGVSQPEAYGGAGADLFHSIVLLETLPLSKMGGFCAAVTVQAYLATGALARRGSEDLKRRYLAPSIAGTLVGALAISEPNTGSDVAAVTTTAVRDRDHYVVSGAKTFITNGVFGDFYVAACRTDPNAGAGGLSLLVIDADLPGIGKHPLKKIGWHSSDTAELSFDGVRVPAANLVGRENRGFASIMETFALERLTAAAMGIGAADLALSETLAYMKSREAFGKPLSRFQALRHRLADLFAELAAVRQLVYHTAWLVSTGVNAVEEAAMAKLLASELGKKVADECLQFHGGYGYIEEYPIARYFRDARVATIVAGTSEIMREIIARVEVDGVAFGRANEEEDRAEAPPVSSSAVSAVSAEPTPAAPPPGGPSGLTPLERIFHSLPSRMRAERTEGWWATFHFELADSAQPRWTVEVEPGVCRVREGLEGAASCVVKTSEETYLAIADGRQSAEAAFLLGKIKISNVAEMMKFVKAFGR